MTAYDHNNIFARMIRGEIPAHKVYEDDSTLAFMDIMPRTDGHVLVVPKAPARNILDIAPDALADLMIKTQKIAIAAKQAMGADGLTIQQFSESAGGQVVFHIHMHILPRFDGVALKPHTGAMAEPSLLAEQAARIRQALNGAG